MNASERKENRINLNLPVGDDEYEYNSRTLEPNCVHYSIYFDDVSCALEEKKNEIFKHLEADFEAKEALISSTLRWNRPPHLIIDAATLTNP